MNWALEKQGLGRELLGDSGGSGGGLGVRVDTSLYSNDGKWTHDDAHVIADAIAAMSRLKSTSAAAALVVHYGRLGLRPDWGKDGSGRWQLMRRNNGTGRAIRRYEDARRSRGLVIGFEWEWVGHEPADLDRLMLEWLAWHAALCDLRQQVNPMLRQFVATGPLAPECPWDQGERTIHYPDEEGLAVGENI
ncbi:hypothetical protein [Devosia sp. DBB001]|nr:hypothetical protein [Devosia sp. DBB001]